MSGWDKAPGYGGSGHWLTTTLAAVAVVAVTFAVATSALNSARAAPTGSEIAGVASVIDGDTIVIHDEHIRLDGFDAPEEGKRCGTVNVYAVSARQLDGLIAGRTVHCRVTSQDTRNNRPVAQCRIRDGELGAWMVEQGWARDWPQYSRGRYQSNEARARSERRGIWAMNCPADLWPADRDYSLQN